MTAAVTLALSALLAAGTGSAAADGSIPPQPYHYLQPPPALRANNNPPSPGARTFSVAHLRASRWLLFTGDGQAGIYAPRRAFAVAPDTTAVTVTVRAAVPPPGLPPGLAVDGNVYLFGAVQRPGNAPARLDRSATLTLLWPHLPSAIYVYRGSAWRRLCSFDQMTRTPSTVSCPIQSLGLFAAVHAAPAVPHPAPATPAVPRPAVPRARGGQIGIIIGVAGAALITLALVVILLWRGRARSG